MIEALWHNHFITVIHLEAVWQRPWQNENFYVEKSSKNLYICSLLFYTQLIRGPSILTLASFPLFSWDVYKVLSSTEKYTAISKNVGENDECQLSNGDCTTKKKCGYWVLMANKLHYAGSIHCRPSMANHTVCLVKPRTSSENVASRFCNHLPIIKSHYAWKMRFKYPGIKLKPALGTRQNWTFVIICSPRPHKCKKGNFTS